MKDIKITANMVEAFIFSEYEIQLEMNSRGRDWEINIETNRNHNFLQRSLHPGASREVESKPLLAQPTQLKVFGEMAISVAEK